MARSLGHLACAAVSLLLAAFFCFVGYMKASAPVEELARHGAWTVHIPALLGRMVGWSEMACAVALAAGLLTGAGSRLAIMAAGVLIANQIVAASVHASRSEAAAVPQNLLIIAACGLVIGLHWTGYGSIRKVGERP